MSTYLYRLLNGAFKIIIAFIPLGVMLVAFAFILGIFCGLMSTVYRWAFNFFGGF